MAEEIKKKGFAERFAAIPKFFAETRVEMKKVSWPTWKQRVNNTVVVLTMVAIVAVMLFILDKSFATGFYKLEMMFPSASQATPAPGAPQGQIPQGSIPQGQVPQGQAPQGNAPINVAPKNAVPNNAAPKNAAPNNAQPKTQP